MPNFGPAPGRPARPARSSRRSRRAPPRCVRAAAPSAPASSSIRCTCGACRRVRRSCSVAENPHQPGGRQISLHVGARPGDQSPQAPGSRCSCSPAVPAWRRAPSMPGGRAPSRASTAIGTSCSSISAAPAPPTALNCAGRGGESGRVRPQRRRSPRAPVPALRGLRAAPTSRCTPPASRCRTWSACAPRSATGASISTASPTARASRSTTCAAYPQHTRAVILDGVVPPRRALGATAALDAEGALQDILRALRTAGRVPQRASATPPATTAGCGPRCSAQRCRCRRRRPRHRGRHAARLRAAIRWRPCCGWPPTRPSTRRCCRCCCTPPRPAATSRRSPRSRC